MSHFAEIEWEDLQTRKRGTVKRVISAEQDFIDSGAMGDSFNWVQTSYNTHGGVHYLQAAVMISEAVDEVPAEDEILYTADEAVPAILWTQEDADSPESGGLPDGVSVGDVKVAAIKAGDVSVAAVDAIPAVAAVYEEGKSPEDVGKPDGVPALRKNYAAVGMVYDVEKDTFEVPKPFPSWEWSDDTGDWEPPVACPIERFHDGTYRCEGKYWWNETDQNWDVIPFDDDGSAKPETNPEPHPLLNPEPEDSDMANPE